MPSSRAHVSAQPQLYTRKQRELRDSTVWTLVQGFLAPLQFLVFLISLFLICRYFFSGDGYQIAAYSVVIKTAVLLVIMVTGAIWEKVVFGQYLLAPAFFWEDIVSFFVIALHLIYVIVLFADFLSDQNKMGLALVAYALYLVNAMQFLLKLRAARIASTSFKKHDGEVVA